MDTIMEEGASSAVKRTRKSPRVAKIAKEKVKPTYRTTYLSYDYSISKLQRSGERQPFLYLSDTDWAFLRDVLPSCVIESLDTATAQFAVDMFIIQTNEIRKRRQLEKGGGWTDLEDYVLEGGLRGESPRQRALSIGTVALKSLLAARPSGYS